MKDWDLLRDFQDREYRHAYVDELLNTYIATQIKVLRQQRGWSQQELAERSHMKQSRISVLEDINYSNWNIATLRRLAEAFDVTLHVSFETFGRRIEHFKNFSRKGLERLDFEHDPRVKA